MSVLILFEKDIIGAAVFISCFFTRTKKIPAAESRPVRYQNTYYAGISAAHLEKPGLSCRTIPVIWQKPAEKQTSQ